MSFFISETIGIFYSCRLSLSNQKLRNHENIYSEKQKQNH